MADVLQLTDGVVTADLRNPAGDLHVLWGKWSPAVTTKREGFVGNQSPYVEVVEQFDLHVEGADADDVLGNLLTMSELIDQSQQWAEGDDVNVVLIKYQPTDSTLAAAVQAVLLGYPSGRQPSMILPSDFDALKNNLSLLPTSFRFVRRGQWLGPLETPAASSAADNPVVQVATFSDIAKIPSPYDIVVTGFTDQSHLVINPGIFLISNAAENIQLIEAAGMTATAWTTVDDSANEAVGDDVLRYTATNTSERISGVFDVTATTFDTTKSRVAVFASVRINTASRTFRLRAEGTSFVFNDLARTADRVLESADYTNPTWIQLGWLDLRKGLASLRLVASVNNATSSPTLDIDQIALLAIDTNAYIIRHEAGYLSSPFIPSSPCSVFLKVEPRALSDLTPFVGIEEQNTDQEQSMGHRGDAAIYMIGDELAALWLSTNASDWRDTNQSTGAVTQVQLAGFRRKGYLAPR